MKLAIALFLIFPCIFNVNAYATQITPTKSGLYDVGGFKLYLECYENTKPTLILEQGFGNWGSDGAWSDNIARLTNEFSICLYDRAGLGKSEQSPIPYTVNDIAKNLHTLLNKASVKPPYYFAGGSYASFIIISFNNMYPENVLGAVFIDPAPVGHFYAMGTRWPKNFQTENEELKVYADFDLTVLDPLTKGIPENIDHIKSYFELINATKFGHKPIVTLRARKNTSRYDPPFVPDHIAKVMDELYGNAEAYFKGLSTNSKIIYSESDNHFLHLADPNLVVNTIKGIKIQDSSK